MSQVFLMHTIVSRGMLPKVLSFYQEMKIAANLVTLGRGTAASEVLDYFGLEASEKAVLFSVVTDSAWQEVKKGLTCRAQALPSACLWPASAAGGNWSF